jgi:hypothetical protein
MRWVDPLGLDECTRDDDAALEAERERKLAEEDKNMAKFYRDQSAFENAEQRIDEWIQRYLKHVCQGGTPHPRN